MLSNLRQRKVVRVVFDESHGEAWTIRPEVAATMQPEHPARSSYAAAAALLAEREFSVEANADQALSAALLDAVDVLVIAHPSDAKWERTVGEGSPLLVDAEIEAIATFVARGGGLVVLGETEQDKYGNNVNDLLSRFGVRIENATVFDDSGDPEMPSWVPGEPSPEAAAPALLHLIESVCFYRTGTLATEHPEAVLLRTSAAAQPPGAGLLAAVTYGDGRVVVSADSDLFGDDYLGRHDHAQLWRNLFAWVAAGAYRADPQPLVSEAAQDPAWLSLRDETDRLRLMQESKGEVDLESHAREEVNGRVEAMIAAITALAPRFTHQKDYLEQVVVDLRTWFEGGCAKPDFTASLALFRPEQHRIDGIEHLVVFPMYTPNGSPLVRFEALIVRTPWPEFIERLEAERYDNDKFVPVQLVDFTDGYASECAVLFPETVSVVERPTNNFGGIFCDRESVRFRRAVLRGAEVLQLELPPEAAALVASADLALESFILWDLIHDSWHSHGDLPFDPFMIRQRLPYWMYSLEELRVDLSAFVDAGRLAREGFAFARNVQYAMLFDRILRFPISGNRVRNYDGLGGQLLFAYMHKDGVLRWTDNRLSIDWPRVEESVTALRTRVEALYREGIDSSKVSYWMAAHDLISEFVPPNANSQWQKDRRVYSDESEPRAWVDRVLDDEFPLSTFYVTLQKKLADLPQDALT